MVARMWNAAEMGLGMLLWLLAWSCFPSRLGGWGPRVDGVWRCLGAGGDPPACAFVEEQLRQQPLLGAIRAFGHTPGAMLMSRSRLRASRMPCGPPRRCCSRRQCKTSTQTYVAFSRSWLAGAPPVFSPAESAARWLGLASVRPAAPWHRSGNRTASAGPWIIRATCLTQADILQCKSRWSSSQQHSRTSTHRNTASARKQLLGLLDASAIDAPS